MLVSILVATPHTAFGELLRISLEDSGQYQVRVIHTAKEVHDCASHDSYSLAILDAALAGEPFIPLCMDLLEQQPGIRLVVIPPDNNPNHPALGGLFPHGYLSRPFYLPELIDLVSRLDADREKQVHSEILPNREPIPAGRPTSTIPTWLQEPMTLTGYLEKQLPGTQATAAVVGLNGPVPGSSTGNVNTRASVGALSKDAVQELTEVVFRYWNQSEKTDLMRFIRLNTDRKDLLVYATQITGELVLILIYDASAPLSQVRPRTKALAQMLATLPPDQKPESGPDGAAEPSVIATANQPAEQPPVAAPARSSLEGEPSFINKNNKPSEPDFFVPSPGEPETQPLDDDMLFNRLGSFSSSPKGASSVLTDAAARSETPVQPYSEQQPVENPAHPPAAEQKANLATSADTPSEISPFDEDEDEGETGGRPINLSALLGAVPSPDPDSDSRRTGIIDAGWITDRSASNPIPTLSGGLINGLPTSTNEPAIEQQPPKKRIGTAPLDPQTMPRDMFPGEPAMPVDYSLPADSEFHNPPRPGTGRPASLEVKTEPPVMPPGMSAPVEPASSIIPTPETAINPLEDTHPSVVTTVSSLTQLEPASAALSLLNYTCVLIPRLPQHYLTGEMADRMALWVQQLCLAFGWRLEGISIRPEYLQWTVQVAPAISPGNLVRIVRQRTSMHVFGSYPHLADQNPSGDFWATGYLIVSGAQPPSAQLLRDYIAQTRKRQGVNK